MRNHSSIPATMATALLLALVMAFFGSGCGTDEGSPLAPLEQFETPKTPDPLDGTQSTIPEAGGDALASQASVKRICEQLLAAGSEAEAKAILEALPPEQQAAVNEALQVVQIVTRKEETPIADAGSDPRGLNHRHVAYYVYGNNMFGQRMWEYGESVDWDYDGRYVYNCQSNTWHSTCGWPWVYDKQYREVHGADGWAAYYAYAKGQFTLWGYIFPFGWRRIQGKIPHIGIMVRGNGTDTPTMGCDDGWW